VRHLRRIRAVVALAFLAPAVLMFVDFGRLLPARLAGLVARLQIVPSIVALPALGAALAVGIVAAVTLITGRIYCSTVCPLGTVQDALVRIGDRGRRRGRYRFRFLRPRLALHLAVAAAAAGLALSGSMLALDLVEPYSAFGRILSGLFRPLVAGGVNGLSRALSARHVYAVQPVVFPGVAWGALMVALASLVGLVALVRARGRLFCNLLCPAGAVLRLLARRTAFRIAIDPADCNGCGVCEKACKAGCIDAAGRRVAFDACVGCFDCLDACPRDGIRLEPAWRRRPSPAAAPVEEPADPGRRAVLKSAALVPAALLVPAVAGAAAADPRDARVPVTPPGSLDRRRFTSRCTACHLCVASCPTQVLRPSLLEYGLSGLLQPRLVYDGGACVYDCDLCGRVCPTGAILELPLPEKRLVQVGRARFVKADCIVETKKKPCGACAEHCPTKAIAMVPYQGDVVLRIPEVNEDACIGCGACEHPCPVEPRKAIWVEARSPHGKAKKLEQKPVEKPSTVEEGFPF
jgi:ferredoxin